ncbi:CBS domain-containing protein [Desulforhopalus sp. IMCC35007]|uniref:CBS domain-containing protein n=1 Tax=Desulforhopalus sp. IMCC35007 TaxID=2569543 RepID=UPI0010AE1FA2|nr:CBS domain-containing protein [Desulforhopalus sp. IMCC35007]TKB07561.1 CBS domain-containing protein [Desulforhopalus sp. IMCC35007]
MKNEQQTIRDIMIPLTGFPCLKESSTVREAIQQLRSFCPIGSSAPCGFNELMVVNDQDRLVGRVTQQGILKVLFATLLDPAGIKPFEGRTLQYSDLSTLLNGVLIREGVNHLEASISSVIEKDIRVLPVSFDLIQAMSVMVMGEETVLPVEEQGVLCGVVKLAEIFYAIGDTLLSINHKL